MFNIGDMVLVSGMNEELWLCMESLPDEDGVFFASDDSGYESEFNVDEILEHEEW